MSGLPVKVIYFLVIAIASLFAMKLADLYKNEGKIEKNYLVKEVSGSAQIRHQAIYKTKEGNVLFKGESEWTPLGPSSLVNQGDTIKTSAASSVDIIMINPQGTTVASRIKENSLIQIESQKSTDSVIKMALRRGTALVHALTLGAKKKEIFELRTPTATAGIRGTQFFVKHQQGAERTQVAVSEGVVNVRPDTPLLQGAGVDVPAGKTLMADPVTHLMNVIDTLPVDQEELKEIKTIPTKISSLDSLSTAFGNSKLFPEIVDQMLTEIAKYSMGAFEDAIIVNAGQRGEYPNSLQDIQLEKGNYNDPWGTPYFYKKTGSNSALLISAGPDKILYSSDDIVKFIGQK
ncbi:MAG: FecR domain-containing protein [Burkholderiales bacterium]